MIRASAPTRIDLAGGTIDIWPLCLALERPAVTVNLAIDLRAEAAVRETGDGLLHVRSDDRGEEIRLPVGRITHERLGIATRLAAYYGAGTGLALRLLSRAPPHSGLGGSSALAVALAGALSRLRGRALDLRVVQDLETTLLRTPTGYQDYYPALHGGLNALTAVPGGVEVETIGHGPSFLAPHLLLVDTRMEHASGLTNWEAVKRFFDGDLRTREAFHTIAACAARLRDALKARDLGAVGAALREEWDARRRLSPSVTNARLDALAEAARGAGALAAKVCGAGGGGCMVVLAPDAGDGPLRKRIGEAGGNPLAFRPDPDGLRIHDEGARERDRAPRDS
jgi:D-glycero-alpha-D-manno-heptose-7-phosphate kinase